MWIDRRWRVAAVTVSLLLNVFLIGIVAGHLFSLGAGKRRPPEGPIVRQANVRALPADERAHFLAIMKPHRESIRMARQAHRAARQVVEADIVAAQFDPTKLAADFADLRKADTALQAAANEALVDSLGALSPESRAALVARDVRPSRP